MDEVIGYDCDENGSPTLVVDTKQQDCVMIHDKGNAAILKIDAVAALVGQLTSWIERTRRTDGK